MPLYLHSNGAIIVKNGALATTSNCCCCGATPVLPLTVYRTGGFAFSPSNGAGCTPVEVGKITSPDFSAPGGQVTVSWPPIGSPTGSSYNSVELQVQDACGRCVYSDNLPNNNNQRAQITVVWLMCHVGAAFRNCVPWCNNPMCPLPWSTSDCK